MNLLSLIVKNIHQKVYKRWKKWTKNKSFAPKSWSKRWKGGSGSFPASWKFPMPYIADQLLFQGGGDKAKWFSKMFKSISICSKVLKRVSNVFKSVPKSSTCVQRCYELMPDIADQLLFQGDGYRAKLFPPMGRAYENDLKQRQRFCLRKGEERGIVFILSVGHFPGISLKFCRTVAAVDEYWGGGGDFNLYII